MGTDRSDTAIVGSVLDALELLGCVAGFALPPSGVPVSGELGTTRPLESTVEDRSFFSFFSFSFSFLCYAQVSSQKFGGLNGADVKLL